METVVVFERFGVALALGLLIGLERGWRLRNEAEGGRIAGLRTFGLIGLLGGVWALLARELGPVVLALGFAALAGVLVLAYLQRPARGGSRDYGITTLVAALLTFGLGGVAVSGYTGVAAAGAVVVALLLGLKPTLHDWLRRLSAAELFAVLKFALISLVILPVLPNRGFGPWEVFNPWAIWWLVVLIAGISFVGYIAMKVLGPGRGIPLTGLFGGLTSSTATTLSLARMGRANRPLRTLLAVGIVVSATTMFPRILFEVAIVNPALVPAVLPALALMTAIGFAGAAILWWRAPRAEADDDLTLRNPLELATALQFAALLVVVMLLAEAVREWFGHAGLYALAGLSGLTDVDAITLSIARMARDGLPPGIAAGAITLAAIVNTGVKIALAAVVGGRAMALRLAAPLGAVIGGGALVWSLAGG
jgi:uncharacterized membrane protein (DUF4010 family)